MDLDSQRLTRFLDIVLQGRRDVQNSQDAKRLISALCAQPDHLQCIAKLCASKDGVRAVQKALLLDLSDDALNDVAARFLRYFAVEDLVNVNGGQMLCTLLTAILRPPIMWTALTDAFARRSLTENGLYAFASLTVHLLTLLRPASALTTELNLVDTARQIIDSKQLFEHESVDTRRLAYHLQETLQSSSMTDHESAESTFKPGGRHDNDFADFRAISIFPTKDELQSEEPPYILPIEQVLAADADQRVGMHIDNQFRLLREDMLADLREELQSSSKPGGKRRPNLRLSLLDFRGVHCQQASKPKLPTLALRCFDNMLKHRMPKEVPQRKAFLEKDRTFIKHDSFGCLLADNKVVAFATIQRDEEMLSQIPPILLLRILGQSALRTALQTLKLRRPHEISFVLIDTPYFAYQPVLKRLQEIPSLPLADQLLGLRDHDADEASPYGMEDVATRLQSSVGQDVSSIIGCSRSLKLDNAQTESLVAGLLQPVCLIQGPPGTGKSLIGAVLGKVFYDHAQSTILVICYTNHALDQTLEDFLDMGIPQETVLRLGSKSTARTEPMTLFHQTKERARLPQDLWRVVVQYKIEVENSVDDVRDSGHRFSRWSPSEKQILDGLEFSEHDMDFWSALYVDTTEDDMTIVGERGRAIDSLYLFQRWIRGQDAGVLKTQVTERHQVIWRMDRKERQDHYTRWTQAAIQERADLLANEVHSYEDVYNNWTKSQNDRIVGLMKTKRIVACTTTAAAKYADQLSMIDPGIVLVEEAGEVLESHILTALSRKTKQLVMIGDHLQLRPKIKNYALTVERGGGYDLNCSLFERLVTGGYPHTTLAKQHRMRPEISMLVRRLMYPNLEDDAGVRSRPDMLGLQRNVMFVNHEHPEVSDTRLRDRLDGSSVASRQNIFEAKMILKIVKYLAQQGYGSDKQVVLTPYLGQLRLIVDELRAEHDPVLGDLDSHDLIKAGLISPAGAASKQGRLRVSTIDNFQGEESEIVIASLTRSNTNGEIGFMDAPQRLNVLLSRARNGLIIIGNAKTFESSKKGKKVWQPFIRQLAERGQLFDGLPIKCEQHPKRTMIVSKPEDFEKYCSEGGCDLPCDAFLQCRKHRCPDKCHQIVDHTKKLCYERIQKKCAQGHTVMIACCHSSQSCHKCERDKRLQDARQQKQDEYLSRLIAIEDKISAQKATVKDLEDAAARASTLKQKESELAAATQLAKAKEKASSQTLRPDTSSAQTPDTTKPVELTLDTTSEACRAWQDQKKQELAENEHIDAVMSMIGLENVKSQILTVKDKVDTSLRQGTSLMTERFSAILYGNPGTGKTTVARLYAKCLASMAVVAGAAFSETSASKLMNGGVAAYKKLIDNLLTSGGGALFIDEAYQLTDGTNASGKQVLDAVMDDAENLVGKVVFILAGYRKQMETLLAHNPGLPTRFPYEFNFDDYDDHELLKIFEQKVHRRFEGRMKLEDGPHGLFARIVARRVGYGRGIAGFGNARAVENTVAKILSRQATRLAKDRRSGKKPDDFLLCKDDLLGPEPSGALQQSKAWTTLQQLIGLDGVKQSVRTFMQTLKYNYERELEEKPLLQFNLNKVFLGSPGTGKTTVAKLYGQILADIGMLSNGEVIVKNPSDFVGDVIGGSERLTKGILSSTVGKVLVIDEAYGLCRPTGVGQSSDLFRTAVIDTLVAEIQSVPGDDRCVLLLGYQDEMEKMLQDANPGLARRFPTAEAFQFHDFSDAELMQVLQLKLKQQGYTAKDDAVKCVMEALQRARNKLHFGNAGEIDILLNAAKQRHQQRCTAGNHQGDNALEAVDFDLNYGNKAGISIADLFKDSVGHESLIKQFQQIKNVVGNMRARGLDPRGKVPFNFVFCGPPGTGKTTTARKMGSIYHDIGILATEEVLERSASDLIGQYVGHTAEKTKKLLESALGKVLLIDEAYRLAHGQFARDALDELVDLTTKPQFSQKLVIILAGYDRDIEELLATNPGLSSRFENKVPFSSLSPESCIKLLLGRLQKESCLDISALAGLVTSSRAAAAFDKLIGIGDWANGRDVETLAKVITRGMLQDSNASGVEQFQVETHHVLAALDDMIDSRLERAKHRLVSRAGRDAQDAPTATWEKMPDSSVPPRAGHGTTRATQSGAERAESPEEVHDSPVTSDSIGRDAGVSDEVWAMLKADKRAAADQDKHDDQVVAQHNELEQQMVEHDGSDSDDPEDEDDERAARARAARAQREQERILYEQLRRQKVEVEERRKHEQKMQQKLRQLGICPMGYQWVKQASGYRCSAGAHFVSDASLQ